MKNKIFNKKRKPPVIILEVMMSSLGKEDKAIKISLDAKKRIAKAIGRKSVLIAARKVEVGDDYSIIVVSFIADEEMKEMIFDEECTRHSEAHDSIKIETMTVAKIGTGSRLSTIYFAIGGGGLTWKSLS